MNKNISYCSFCGKNNKEVKYLLAGPTVFICNECVDLCKETGTEIINNNIIIKSLEEAGYF